MITYRAAKPVVHGRPSAVLVAVEDLEDLEALEETIAILLATELLQLCERFFTTAGPGRDRRIPRVPHP